jgi:hypothetical protein
MQVVYHYQWEMKKSRISPIIMGFDQRGRTIKKVETMGYLSIP